MVAPSMGPGYSNLAVEFGGPCVVAAVNRDFSPVIYRLRTGVRSAAVVAGHGAGRWQPTPARSFAGGGQQIRTLGGSVLHRALPGLGR